jgi:branched-chain amino acid transport system ATP-binding protein
MHDGTVLELDSVNAFYGASQVLFDLSLSLRNGEVRALLGRNGAGKSTTVKSVMGLVSSRGRISLRGERIDTLPTHAIAKRGCGFVPEDRQVFTQHTVEENLRIAAKLGTDGARAFDLARIYELFPRLAEHRDRAAGRMSGGEQQMLSIARTLMGNPDVLLLDEPSEGLAPIIVKQIAELLVKLRESGQTVLLAEQNMRFCLSVSTDVSIIDKGRIVFNGTLEEFRGNVEVQHRYLTA